MSIAPNAARVAYTGDDQDLREVLSSLLFCDERGCRVVSASHTS